MKKKDQKFKPKGPTIIQSNKHDHESPNSRSNTMHSNEDIDDYE